MKPAASKPITPSTRARTGSGRWRPKPATASIHSDCISTHSSIEPSCEPQAALKRYIAGSIELEFSATLRTEKSSCRNERHQAGPRQRHEQRLPAGQGPRHRHPRRMVAPGAGQRQHAERQRQQQREDQSEVADFRNHRRSWRRSGVAREPTASTSSQMRGMHRQVPQVVHHDRQDEAAGALAQPQEQQRGGQHAGHEAHAQAVQRQEHERDHCRAKAE